ncbi:MAG: hypothetical protein KDB14_05190 [Planctomycetales bacterium]|nr:hypothetical protein [Planctomycetales bacterium]
MSGRASSWASPFRVGVVMPVIVFAASLLAGTREAVAHPRHEALAEAEWNRATGKLEVSLRLRPEDLEQALTRMLRSGHVNLDSTADVDRHLLMYLKPRFVIRKGDERMDLTWVGKEVDLRHVWIYFEVDLPHDPTACQVSFTMLMDLLPDQVNTLNLRDGEKRWSHRFSLDQPVVSLIRNPEPAGQTDE